MPTAFRKRSSSRAPRRTVLYQAIKSGQLRAVIGARMRAAVDGIDQGTEFCEGHELDKANVALVPETAIGRLLSQDEAAKLIRLIGRKIPSDWLLGLP